MKRLLFLAILPLFLAAPLFGQEEEDTITIRYIWDTWIFENDSARFDPSIPFAFPTEGVTTDLDPTDGTQWRGFGQVVSLGINKEWFDPIFGSGPADTIHFTNGFTDQDYINQFTGVQRWTLDTIVFFAYLRDAATQFNTVGGTFSIWKINTNLRDTGNYQRRGFVFPRESLGVPLFEELFDGSRLANALDPLLNRITPHVIGFPVGELTFEAGESALILYSNDFDDAKTFEQLRRDSALPDPMHYGISFREHRDGTGSTTNPFTGTLTPNYKALGVVMFREGEGSDVGDPDTDTIYSAWARLVVGGRSSMMDTRTRIGGTALLDTVSGVRWHYGHDASEQGLGEVVPNPSTDHARLPFSLTKTSHVTIDIFDAVGTKVATLVEDQKYITGKYDVVVPVDQMTSGTYVARMSTGDQVYTIKFSVTK